MDEDQFINVKYCKEDGEVKDNKDLAWPQDYNSFIKNIGEKFGLDLENTKISIQLINEDDEEVNINSKEYFEEYVQDKDNVVKECKFFVEKSEGPIHSANGDLKKILEESVIKEDEIDVDDILKDIIDNDEYKEKMKADEINYSKTFKNNLEKTVNDMLKEKLSDIKDKINVDISNYSAASLVIQKDTYNSICTIKDDLNEIKEQTDGMNRAINDLHASIQNNELILSSAQYLNKIKGQKSNNNSKIGGGKNEIEMSKIIKKEDIVKNQKNLINPNPVGLIEDEEEKDEEDDNIISLKFGKPIIENIIDIKSAKFFDVENIKIVNIGKKKFKSLVFYKDNDKSSKDINFQTNNRDMNLCEISVPGEFQAFECGTTLMIDNAKQDQTYEMVIYIREKGKNKNISEPLKIVVKFKKAEDPSKQKEKKANQIYEELKDEFQENINLIEKNEIINQLIKNGFKKDQIQNALNIKIQEIQENKNRQKIEEIYNELDFHNYDFQKNEIANKIKEHNFDKENVQDWINGKVTEKIYEQLTQLEDVDINGINEEDVKEKIKELKFNLEEIKKAYHKEEPNPEPEPEPNPVPVPGPNPEDEKVNQLFQELDEDFGIAGFMDEDGAKAKIRELNCDKEKCIEWIEGNLMGD